MKPVFAISKYIWLKKRIKMCWNLSKYTPNITSKHKNKNKRDFLRKSNKTSKYDYTIYWEMLAGNIILEY